MVTAALVDARNYQVTLEDLPPLEGAPVRGPAESDLGEVEREAILAALHRTSGHHQKAADLLGISRRTLTRKLKLYRTLGEEDSDDVD